MRDDPRFRSAVQLLNAGDWLEASDAFEELYFEAVRGEVEIVRVLLQVATGLHHTTRGHARPAIERLEEGLRAAAAVRETHGVDLPRLCADVRSAVEAIRAGGDPRVVVYLAGA